MRLQHSIVLLLVLLAIFTTRLILSFSEPHLETGETYLTIRLIDQFEDGHISENEELTYNGVENRFFPVFYLLHWPFQFIDSDFFYTIFPKLSTNLLYTAVSFMIFLISFNLTHRFGYSLFVSLISGFVPVFVSNTIYRFTPLSLFVPVFLLMIYFFLRFIDSSRYFLPFLFSTIVLCFIDINAYIILPSFLIFYLLTQIESISLERRVSETILIASFIVFWILIVFLRPALEIHGISVIFQNIPKELWNSFFQNFNLFEVVYNIGLFVVFFGLYTIFKLFDTKNTKQTFLVAVLFSVIGLLLITAIPFVLGQIMIALLLCIFLSHFFHSIDIYITHSKFSSKKYPLMVSFILLVFLSIAIPSLVVATQNTIQEETLTQSEYQTIRWMDLNVPDDAVVLSSYRQADAITALANQPTLLGSDFLMVENINQYFEDTRSIYQTISETQALRLLTRYNISYLLVTQEILDYYSISSVSYVQNSSCFTKIYDVDNQIYSINCVMEPLVQ